MKIYRTRVAISVLCLFVLLAGFAKQSAAASENKTVKQSVSLPQSPGAEKQSPAIKPAGMATPKILQAPLPLNRNAVGCVFPLTGRFADAGNKALDAVLLSAKLFNSRSASPWEIIVADSGETPAKTKEAVAYLADAANVMAIVALSGTAEATDAAREAQKRQVPLILIASKEGVTQAGEYVFQHFLTPTQQTEALAKYAVDTLHIAVFSVLYPRDEYGEEMVRLFRRDVQKLGGKVVKAIPYGKTQTDFAEQMEILTGKKIGESEKGHAAHQEGQNRLPLDCEALFIPDSPRRVKVIADHLAFHDVKGIQLLGTSLWHSSDLLRGDARHMEGAVFADSFLVNGFLPQTNDFVDAYYSAYGREPGNIDALSYDTMEMILGVLEDRKIKTRAEFLQALLVVDRFEGATGRISFRGNRVSQKDAFILRVQNGKIEQMR
jgi:branched-chain amino acid transport system substrate-binding protein